MRYLPIFSLSLMLSVSACGQDSQPEIQSVLDGSAVMAADANAKALEKTVKKTVKRSGLNADNPAPTITCTGVAEQGGAVKCQTRPNQKVKLGRSEDDFYYEQADENGEIIIGFDRDEKRALISAGDSGVEYNFTPREYKISRIDGLPPSQVSSFNDDQLKRIHSSTARKKIGFKSRVKPVGLKNGFIYPLKDVRKTSPFGAQRILNGEAKRPHYGVDIAAPVGTPIYAPADGIVSLADDDLYFEGAMVMLDHGQGLNSMYLHVSEIFVTAGQAVKQGEKIAAIGSRGRSTGPHLCWRMKWRNRNLDPELLTKWPDAEHVAEAGETHANK
jgi:murein DD-endopeptidase MepM/ murein hydrolase activator NlpD